MRSESDVATSWGERRAPRLGELLHRLVSEIGELIDQRITLLRLELKEQVSTAVRDLVLVLLGAVLATLGMLRAPRHARRRPSAGASEPAGETLEEERGSSSTVDAETSRRDEKNTQR